MRRRDQWIRWMKAVEREAAVVAFALEVLQERLHADSSLFRHWNGRVALVLHCLRDPGRPYVRLSVNVASTAAAQANCGRSGSAVL